MRDTRYNKGEFIELLLPIHLHGASNWLIIVVIKITILFIYFFYFISSSCCVCAFFLSLYLLFAPFSFFQREVSAHTLGNNVMRVSKNFISTILLNVCLKLTLFLHHHRFRSNASKLINVYNRHSNMVLLSSYLALAFYI